MADIKKYNVNYSLSRITRCNDFASWPIVREKDIQNWSKVNSLLKTFTYNHQGCTAQVTVDWSRVIDHINLHAELEEEHSVNLSQDKFKEDVFNPLFESEKNNKITCEVIITGKNTFSELGWYGEFFADRLLYDFFCIMNLSVPGSCDFLNLRLIENNDAKPERHLLSSYNFEDALYSSLSGDISFAKVIPLEDVIAWYRSLDLGVRLKAKNQVEKALFSLLNIAKLDGDLASVMWIFHALEAIYSTRVGEGFTNLFRRISGLLGLNNKEMSRLKKGLRKLYDHRSSIVHGGYEVHFPLDWTNTDSLADEDVSKNFEHVQFGFNLILASIQALICKGWYGININESIEPKLTP